MCTDCQPPQEPCQDCLSDCLDCVQQHGEVVPVGDKPNYCAEIVEFFDDLKKQNQPCTLTIANVAVQESKVQVTSEGEGGIVEYSDNGIVWQLSNVFDKPVENVATYYAREKSRPACLASRVYVFEEGPVECTPNWVDAIPEFTICIDQVRHKKQVDGCGGERFVEMLNDWQPTGRTRCSETCLPAPVAPTIQTNITTVCQNQTVVIEAIGGSGTIKWFNKNNLTASIGEGPSISVGYGTFVAKAENLCGSSVFSNEITISLSELTAPSISAVTYQLCGSQTTTITATGGSSGSVKWYKNGILTPTTGATFPSATQGTYYAVIENDCGTSPASQIISIAHVEDCGCSPQPSMPAIFADRTVLCGTQNTTLSATGYNGTLTWLRNGIQVGTGNPLVTTSAGVYVAVSVTTCGESAFSNQVTISHVGNCGCNPQPTPPTIFSDDLIICANQSTILEAAGGSGDVIKWYKNGEYTQTTGSFYMATGGGVYSARYTNACGESGDSNILIVTYQSVCSDGIIPSAQISNIQQPQCVNGELSMAVVTLNNIQNVHHYRYCIDSQFTCPNDCDTPDGIIESGVTTMPILIPASAGGTSRIVTIRLFRDTLCEVYFDMYTTITSPTCGQPAGTATVVTQPQCLNGSLTQGVVRLIGLENVSRVRYCYQSTFTCNNTCNAPDFAIPEGSNTFDMSMAAPAQGVTQPITFRLYRDGNCNVYKDTTIQLTGANCQCSPQPETPGIVRLFPNGDISEEISSVCGNETAILQASETNGTIKWYRTSDLSVVWGTGPSIEVGAGSYQAKSTTVCGESGLSNIITVTNNGPCGGCNAAAPQLFGGGTYCSGETAIIQAVGVCNNGIIRWRKNGNPLTATGVSLSLPNLTNSEAGTYTAVCDLGNGCVSPSSNPVTLVVSSTTPSAPTISIDNANICGTGIATLTASNTSGTVSWYRNGVATGQTGNSITTQISGTYTAKNNNNCGVGGASNAIAVTYQSNCGCSPAPTSPSVSATLTSICGNQTSTLTATGGNGTTYKWYKDGVFTGITTTTYVASGGGQYTVASTNTCGESAPSTAITIAYQPSCGNSNVPSAQLGSIVPPSCSGNQLLGNFSVYLNNVTNADRYEYCFGSFDPSGCTPNCLSPDGTLVTGTNILSLPAPAQGVSQLVTVRIYNGTNCDNYLDIPVTLASPNCLSLCSIDVTNSGGVGVFDRTVVSTQNGTFYFSFDTFGIADNLIIYKNGTSVYNSGNASGLYVGSIVVSIGDSIRFVVNATISTINGSTINNNTEWRLLGNCSTAYTPRNCSTPATTQTVQDCHTSLVESAVVCNGSTASLRVRVRLNLIQDGQYKHSTLRFSLNNISTGYVTPTASGTGASDYAEYTFTGLTNGSYTLYTYTTLSPIGLYRSFAQINVNCGSS